MTRPIDSVVSNFQSKRRPKEVWGITLWFPPLTQSVMDALDSRMSAKYGSDKEEWPRGKRHVMLLVAMAETEDGKQAFSWGDVETLMDKADYVTLQDVVAFMYSTASGIDPKEESEESEGKTEKPNGSDSDSPSEES